MGTKDMTYEILIILLKEFDMEKGGDVLIVFKLMNAAININKQLNDEHFKHLQLICI